MTKREAIFFLEGMMIEASRPPNHEEIIREMMLEHQIVVGDIDEVRSEIDKLLDKIDAE